MLAMPSPRPGYRIRLKKYHEDGVISPIPAINEKSSTNGPIQIVRAIPTGIAAMMPAIFSHFLGAFFELLLSCFAVVILLFIPFPPLFP